MTFSVISFAPGLSGAQRERAVAASPPCTESPEPYPDLLRDSGWDVVDEIDVTARFDDLTRRDLAAFEARTDRLLDVLGEADLSQRLALRRARLAALGEGLLRRTVFVARPVRES